MSEPPSLSTVKKQPKWKPTKRVEKFNFDEIPGLPALGTRVLPGGKDWDYPDQEKRTPGTVIGHPRQGVLLCLFDKGYLGTYRHGQDNKFDLNFHKDFHKVHKGYIATGCSVRKGTDWVQGEQGGEGVGVVIRLNPDRVVVVRWQNGVIGQHRFGAGGKYDVEVVEEKADLLPIGTVSPSRGGPAQAAPASGPTKSADGHADDDQGWWKIHAAQQWRPLPEQTVNEIEAKYRANLEKALVKYKGKNMKVFLKDMKCELDGTQYDIIRETMNSDDLMSMIEMEKYLPAI